MQSVSTRSEIIFLRWSMQWQRKSRESAGSVLRTAGIKRASYENFIFAGQAVPDFIPCTVTAEKMDTGKMKLQQSRAASVCCGKIYGADPVF